MVLDPKTEAAAKGSEYVHHIVRARNYHMANNIEKPKRVCQHLRRVTCSAIADSQADVNRGQKLISWRTAVFVSTSQKEAEHSYDRMPFKFVSTMMRTSME